MSFFAPPLPGPLRGVHCSSSDRAQLDWSGSPEEEMGKRKCLRERKRDGSDQMEEERKERKGKDEFVDAPPSEVMDGSTYV